jgi:hypothetical protein
MRCTTSPMGQTEKNSMRANAFRFSAPPEHPTLARLGNVLYWAFAIVAAGSPAQGRRSPGQRCGATPMCSSKDDQIRGRTEGSAFRGPAPAPPATSSDAGEGGFREALRDDTPRAKPKINGAAGRSRATKPTLWRLGGLYS